MYASVVCERHRALSVAAEAQVSLPWYVFLMTTRALRGTLRVVVPSLQRETVSALPLVIQRARVDVPAAVGIRRRRG